MFDKLFGQKEKGAQVFTVPLKKYNIKINDLSKQNLQAVKEMEKYVTTLTQKLEIGKEEYQKLQQKNLQLTIQLQSVSEQIGNLNQQVENYKKIITESENNEDEFNKYKSQNCQLLKQNDELTKKVQLLEDIVRQQKIKQSNLQLNLRNLEAKQQQNKRMTESMYEQRAQKEGKITIMSKKLKEYKHMIQYLKKQKSDIEKTYERKVKKMQEGMQSIDSDQNQNSVNSNMTKSQVLTQEQNDLQKNHQEEIQSLNNMIQSLKQQNENLRIQKQQFEEQNLKLQQNIKSLTQKKQQVINQIKRITSMTNLKPDFLKLKNNDQQQKSKTLKQNQRNAIKKAYKAFDIITKSLSHLYKNLVSLYADRIQNQQFISLQKQMNIILQKSMQMKDIFQDYL